MTTYEKILNKLVGQNLILPGFEQIVHSFYHHRAKKIADYLDERASRLTYKCENCGEKFARKNFCIDVYDTPWDTEPRTACFCSEKCMDQYLYEGDFSYFHCTECERLICEQNPSNGWHVQVRYVNGEPYCLQCYQEMLLKDGIPLEDFEEHKLSGMFFDSKEVNAAGFEPVPGFQSYFIQTDTAVKRYCDKAIALIKSGYKVITDYERLAYGGSEGYVSMYKKKR